MTGYTVVTRDAEFEDGDLGRLLAYMAYQRGVGPCGFHHSLTNDLSNTFTLETTHCNLCAEIARHGRVQAERDGKTLDRYGDKGPPASAPIPSDGRATYARMMHPLEVVAARANRGSAVSSPALQPQSSGG